MHPIKMIRIRNPWGFTGRIYLPNMENPDQIEIKEERVAGTFDLELKDFCRYYESYTSTQNFADVRVLAEKRKRLALKMQNLLNEDHVLLGKDSQYDLASKIAAYFECKDDLVSIQMTAVELLNEDIHQQIADAFRDQQKNSKEVMDSLNGIIADNKITMMNIFQTSDCELIAASINYWWQNAKQQRSPQDETVYEHQLIDSVRKNNLLWNNFVENYQTNASLALQPLNKSLRLVNELFASIKESQQFLQPLLPQDEGYVPFLKALLLQTALLQQHIGYLEQHERLLQQYDIKIDAFREKAAQIDAYIEELMKNNPKASRVKIELEQELPEKSVSLDDFTTDIGTLLNDLAQMSLGLTKYHEIDQIAPVSSPENKSEPQKSRYLPQWLVSLGKLLERVLKGIAHWNSPSSNEQTSSLPGYNKEPTSDSKYSNLFKGLAFFVPVVPDGETMNSVANLVFNPNS